MAIELIYSRHAKQRTELYGIDSNTLKEVISSKMDEGIIAGDVNSAVSIKPVVSFGLPVKVIFRYIGRNKVFIISAYPLKKGNKG